MPVGLHTIDMLVPSDDGTVRIASSEEAYQLGFKGFGAHDVGPIVEDLPVWPPNLPSRGPAAVGNFRPPARQNQPTRELAVSDSAPIIGSDSSEQEDNAYIGRSWPARRSLPARPRPASEAAGGMGPFEEQMPPLSSASTTAVSSAPSLPLSKLRSLSADDLDNAHGELLALERLLAQMDDEESELRINYDAEVVRCADLRDELESLERGEDAAATASKANLEAEHRTLQAELDEFILQHCRSNMIAEDDLGHCGRLLDARKRELYFLEQRLSELQRKRHALIDGHSDDAASMEDALRRADKDMCELQLDIEKRETTMKGLDDDVNKVIEFMISMNIEAAGGVCPDLEVEDFLPQCVREHLDLSNHAETHVEALFKKFEVIMAESSPPELEAHMIEAAADTESPEEQEQDDDEPLTPSSATPFVVAELLEVHEHDAAVVGGVDEKLYAQFAFESFAFAAEQPLSPVSASKKARPPVAPSRPVHFVSSASFEAECRLLTEGLEQETRALSGSLGAATARAEALRSGAPLPGYETVASRPTDVEDAATVAELLRSAARGHVDDVKMLLPRVRFPWVRSRLEVLEHQQQEVGSAVDKEQVAFLGWTPWHAAAFRGHCEVLEFLKEDAIERCEHYSEPLERKTGMGLTPIAVACLGGHMEVVRSLLRGMAAIDSVDARGNTPLHLAAASGRSEVLIPMLLDAGANPQAVNWSMQQAEVAKFLVATPLVAARRDPALGPPIISNSEAPPGFPSRPANAPMGQQEDPAESYRCIRAQGAAEDDEKKKSGLFSRTWGALKAPIRDASKFMMNQRALAQAQLSSEESASGVWSDCVNNVTHSGIASALEARPEDNAGHQVLVLTTERLLLFSADWTLMQVIALSEVAQLIITSYSTSVLILRMHRVPDLLLDLSASARGRLIEELQLATNKVAQMWGGQDFGTLGAELLVETEPVSSLLDEKREQVASLVFIEINVFLVLPYVPNSVLLSPGVPSHFGFMDFHRSSSAGGWVWRRQLFMLRGQGDEQALVWCQHPCDEVCAGCVKLTDVSQVQPLDTPNGEACMIIDCPDGVLTLRAPSVTSRAEWIHAIRTLQVYRQ